LLIILYHELFTRRLVIHVYYKLYAYDYRINFYNRDDLYKIYKGVR